MNAKTYEYEVLVSSPDVGYYTVDMTTADYEVARLRELALAMDGYESRIKTVEVVEWD